MTAPSWATEPVPAVEGKGSESVELLAVLCDGLEQAGHGRTHDEVLGKRGAPALDHVAGPSEQRLVLRAIGTQRLVLGGGWRTLGDARGARHG